MNRALPPLNSLRAFEVAARRLSFTRAAEELGVTQAAISHHIRILEEHFGFRLFWRLNNSLVLTETAEAYLPSVSQAFDLLCSGSETVRGTGEVQTLRISALPNFALRWLAPRLVDFKNRNMHIDIDLLTSYRGTDFLRENIDAAIRLGGDWHELNADYLFSSEMFPVCSPALLAERPLNEPRELAGHTLLHVSGSREDWPLWLAAAGASEVATDRGPSFDSYVLAMEAAAYGCGVAMACSGFVQDDLAKGRLVAPLSLRLSRAEAWYLLWPKTRTSHTISLFRSWLLGQAAQTRGAMERPAA